MDLAQAQETFIVESSELLQEMENALLHLETRPDDLEAVHALFRAAHTIKGSAGLFGFDQVVAFTHVVESVLEQLRDGLITLNADLSAVLLACRDHAGALIDQAVAGSGPDDDMHAHGEALLARLRTHAQGPAAGAGTPPAPVTPAPVEVVGRTVATDNWHISLRFGRDVLRNGMDPLSFIRYLATLGEIVNLTTLPDALPPAADMDPESCYLGFEIDFHSAADKDSIERVFEFVQDDCQIRILPPHSRIDEYLALIEELPEDKLLLGEILIQGGALTARELEEALAAQRAGAGAATEAAPQARLGEILVEEGVVHPPVVEAALEKQKQTREHKAQESKFIRVQADKLDQLIDLIGELVIAGAGTSLIASRAGHAEMQEAASLMARLVEHIREHALRLRMVQIGETFNRFQRVVREVSRELGKDIELVISGGDTELDKSVIEKIGDPLMHLVRNAMDHGIEPAELRLARGKPARGRLRLNAYHESSSIVIEVADDGGGLSRERILKKALDKGLIEPGQTLADAEVYKLVFEPGFSTAEQVTNLSGRGVGMDVVKRNIEALRGSIEVDTREGEGTTFRIRLPLTLAIIDGFLVGVGRASYVLPLDAVVECIELSETERQAARGRDYISLRGEVLPFLRLRDLFALEAGSTRRESIVVVEYAGRKAGLVVDELLGEFQTVIKPLGKVFQHLRGISGSTILGSGEVALILDVPNIIQRAVTAQAQAQRSAAGRGLLH
ncbi:chemotaxis protein CheA [Thermithiobacillus tepidarius DSM 3134]|uniref:chemotaxis protein CheA n=1 Tax=Thermithiobacillus tepidarius TaxID=929 RepID=UPI0003F4FAFB|nr:chemotaxis protein CheA [Thermithiobacillus tepidarius]